MAIGDAIFESGNGGTDLERYEQLASLTKTLYAMSQDSPECAAAVWSRRLGIFQKGQLTDYHSPFFNLFTLSLKLPRRANQLYPRDYVTLKLLLWVMLAGMNSLHGHQLECCC